MFRTSTKVPSTMWGCLALVILMLSPFVLAFGSFLHSDSEDRSKRVTFEIPVRLGPDKAENSVELRCIVPKGEYVCDLHAATPALLPEDCEGVPTEIVYRVTGREGRVLCEGKKALDLSPEELRSRRGWYGVIPLFAAPEPETHLHIQIDMPSADEVPIFVQRLSLRFMSYSDMYKEVVGEEICPPAP